jgi:tRNA (guanosine-2'-O-)-methyltransferase
VAGIDQARAAGYHVVGLELADGARPLHELDAADATCLVVGHEDRGCSPATLAACDEVAYLPQLGKVGSLNVATAASIGIYELRRGGWTEPTTG